MKSTLGKLSSPDFWKGLLIAVLTPTFILLQQLIPSWTDWLASHLGGTAGAVIVQAAASAFVSYILKQVGTDTTEVAIKRIQQQGGDVVDAAGNKVPTIVKKPIAPDL